MIQQVRKVNILATSAMLVTFSVSVFLVTFMTPAKPSFKKCEHSIGMWVDFNKLETSTFPCGDSWRSDLLDQISGVFRSQPDSPIRFIAFGGWSTMSSTGLYLTNRSNRTIRAFAVGHRGKGLEQVDDQARLEGLWDPPLEPGESRMISVYWHWKELWIDFVEFSDGSTWGPDEMNSQKNLDATRAGMKEATSRFTKILQERGPDILAASFWKETINPQSQMHDNQWKQDFDSTVNSVRSELESIKYDAFKQFRHRDERNAVLRDKFSAVLSRYAEAANPGLSATDTKSSKKNSIELSVVPSMPWWIYRYFSATLSDD